jgi:L-amino acid N-acyltransferase YncA/putative methionine-R-sulfoxide reductase with GAF domain
MQVLRAPGPDADRRESMMPLIRTATELDVPAITEIYAHHVRHGAATFEIEPPDCAEVERRRMAVLSQGLPYLVAETDGHITGYAYATRYRTRAAYRFTVEDSVYIHPDYRARGLGRILLDRLIELCNAEGCRQMIAVIGDSSNVASIRIHERLGFRRVGVLESVGRKFGRWIDVVIMQRALDGDTRLAELKPIVNGGLSRISTLQQVAEFLRRCGNHRWVGLYDVDYDAGEIRNAVFSGPAPPSYPAFPIGKGLTGIAITENRTVNIGDVTLEPRYLTALSTTRSELIVPIVDEMRKVVVGTIDIESDALQAFDDKDQVFYEDCAEIIGPIWRCSPTESLCES